MFKIFNSSKKEQHPNIDENLYNWKYIDVSELDNYSNGINDIYEKKYVGFIIKNVFSKEEVSIMKQGVEGMDTSKMIATGVGYSYPRIFAQLVKPHDGSKISEAEVKQYFEECEELPAQLEEILNVNFKERIEAVFKKISGGRNVKIPKGYDGEGKYAMGSIRMNLGGKGFIPVHCGNYFQQEFPVFYKHLKTEVKVEDQLSYFVTVNPAESGGELSLFDLKWELGQKKEDTGDDKGASLSDGTFIDMGPSSLIRRQKVKPGAGDLLIFSGGPIWHKVELVKGKQTRITIGGFLAFTEDRKTLKYWT